MMATTTTSSSTTLKTPTRGRRGARSTTTKKSQFIPPAPLGSMLEQPTCSSESLSPPKAARRTNKNKKNNWGHLSLEQGLSIHEARNKALLEDGTSETSSSSSEEGDDEVSDSQMIAQAPPPAHHHHHPFAASSKTPPLRQESIQKFLDTMNTNTANTGGAAFDDIGELFDDITIASVGSVRSRSRSKSKHNKRSRSSNSKHNNNNRRSKSVGKHGENNSCRSTRSKSRESNNNTNNSSHHGGRSSRAACKLSKALEKLEQINKQQDETSTNNNAPKTVTSHSRISRKGGRTARTTTGRLVKSNEGLGQMAASIKRQHARMSMGISKDDSFKAELGEMPLQGSFGSLGNDPNDDPLVAGTGNRRSKSLHRTEQRRSRPSNSSRGNNLASSSTNHTTTRRRGDLKTRRLASSSSSKKGAEANAPKERTVHRSKSDDLVLLTGGFSREKK